MTGSPFFSVTPLGTSTLYLPSSPAVALTFLLPGSVTVTSAPFSAVPVIFFAPATGALTVGFSVLAISSVTSTSA